MIAFLKGRVAAVEPEAVIMDVGGIGYRVNVTAGCAANLRGNTEEVQLHTHMLLRDDDIQLFGFATPGEVAVFLLLLGVNGVGPKAALAVLSALTPGGLGQALALEDSSALTRVPGVGKKTAQRIILELKDKFAPGDIGPALSVQQGDAAVTGVPNDAISALVALGYSGAEAGEAVRGVIKTRETPDLQQLIKLALQRLDQSQK
ncbi:MAG: Holliday junction branch migration protein RuvA [Firmicutes bacterium]|nr:Holliday junction branch migration protein RuvA [Bacillota bacterium]